MSIPTIHCCSTSRLTFGWLSSIPRVWLLEDRVEHEQLIFLSILELSEAPTHARASWVQHLAWRQSYLSWRLLEYLASRLAMKSADSSGAKQTYTCNAPSQVYKSSSGDLRRCWLAFRTNINQNVTKQRHRRIQALRDIWWRQNELDSYQLAPTTTLLALTTILTKPRLRLKLVLVLSLLLLLTHQLCTLCQQISHQFYHIS